jgi:hypothetical protein
MHYSKSHSITASNVTPEQIWRVWSDFEKRHLWDDDIEWAKLNGEFKAGNTFIFKPKGGPKLKMHIIEATKNKSFADCFKMLFTQLCGIHTIKESPKGLILTTTITVKGPLRWILQKLVAEKIVATLPHQTELLLKAARAIK